MIPPRLSRLVRVTLKLIAVNPSLFDYRPLPRRVAAYFVSDASQSAGSAKTRPTPPVRIRLSSHSLPELDGLLELLETIELLVDQLVEFLAALLAFSDLFRAKLSLDVFP